MKTFVQFLNERVLSPGLNPKHNKYIEIYRKQIHDIIQSSYSKIGGYGGLAPGSKEESDAIHADIGNPNHAMKLTKRGDNITSVIIYKHYKGRKDIVLATNGTPVGKRDLLKTMEEDNKFKRAWGEASGAVARLKEKMGYPKVPSSKAKELTGKPDIEPTDEDSYTRFIGGLRRRKTIYGYPKS